MVCFAHKWNGCTCVKCGKNRQENHLWDGCICTICGMQRDEQHRWNGCVCSVCGLKRDENHNVENCICTNCGREIHSWNGCVCRECGKEREEHVLRLKYDCPGCGRKKESDMRYLGPGKPLEVRVNCLNCGFADCLPFDTSFKGECQCHICGETVHILDDQCRCKLCWEFIHDVEDCRCKRCNKMVHDYHEGVCKNCGDKAKVNIVIDLQCRSCGEKLDHLIIAGKWGAYEKALCPHPECGEPYRYRGFNKKSGHDWLIVADDNNATIYKCVRCGAWYETNLGDIVYQSPEAQYNCVK